MNKKGIRVIKWRIRKKYELMAYKGNKCEHCGFDDISIPNAFNFHHKDPEEKDFSISGKSFSFTKLKAEVDKCMLLCTICHARIHAEPFKEMYTEALTQKDNLNCKTEKNKKIRIKGGNKNKRSFCKMCNIPITTGSLYCLNHFNQYGRVTKKPDKKELFNLLKNTTKVEIAKKYGVSEAAVRKWIKSYNKMAPGAGIEPALSDLTERLSAN